MPTPLRILVIAAEAAPFAKTGGLADVIGSLPKALAALGHDVRVIMPAYGPIEQAARDGRNGVRTGPVELRVPTGDGLLPAGVLESRLPGSDVPVYFVAERNLFARPDVYGYWDDPYRFAFFSRAALDLAIAALGWRPDIVHAHDWHAAASILWLATAGQEDDRYRGIPSVITIHNLQHQGRAPRDILRYLGLGPGSLREEAAGEVNLLARAVFHATMVSTVSPTYAREILTPDGGAGLDGLLRHRHFDVHGILNGLDYDVWDPSRDPHLAAPFDAASLDRRVENKRAMQVRLHLPRRDDVPVVAMVSRLDAQKGFDIVGHAVHLLLNGAAGDAQFVVLGEGAPQYQEMFRHLASYHRDTMTAVTRVRRDPRAAHLRRQRHFPDAVSLRAVRARATHRDALREHPARPCHRRAGRYGARRRGRLHVPRIPDRGPVGRAPSRPVHLQGGPRQLAGHAALRHGHGCVVGHVGPGVPAAL